MKIRKIGNTIYPPKWPIIMHSVLFALMSVASIAAFYFEGLSWELAMFGFLALIFAYSIIDSIFTRVVLEDGSLRISRIIGSKEYSWESISKVTWEKGAGVSILVDQSDWYEVPSQGNCQSMCNIIRSRLKKPQN